MTLPLSILDLAPVGAGIDAATALRSSVSLARAAESLGYTRFWVAEHHNIPSIASSSPEVLISAIAGATNTIRVGSGGVMLPNQAPLRVVEAFRTLEALYPGRIDLGIGRAPGTDLNTARALRRPLELNDDGMRHIAELLAFDDDAFPPGHPFAAIKPIPNGVRLDSIWMLGSTTAGAKIAATIGTPYAFAGHFNLDLAVPAMQTYRERFEPSHRAAKPKTILALSVLCADTDEEARRLTAIPALSWLRLIRNELAPLPSLEEALAFPFTTAERAQVASYVSQIVVGSPTSVRDRIETLVNRTGADEVMIATLLPDPEERRRIYERVARVFGLA